MKNMREKVVSCLDYIIKILAILVATCFVGSLIYKNIHIYISLDMLMYIMSAIVVADYILYALDIYKNNIQESKIIRGCIWTVVVCVCNVKALVLLFVISLIFWIYICNKKRKLFDLPFTFMVACLGLEAISILDMFYSGEYRNGAKILNGSMAVDILCIVAVLIYLFSDKIENLMTKLPSIEKGEKYNSSNLNGKLFLSKRMIYAGVLIVGVFLGLHTYDCFLINKGELRTIILSVMIVWQIAALYFMYNEICGDLNRISRVLVAMCSVCLPYTNYRNYSLKVSLIYCCAFTILFLCFKLVHNKKLCWIIAVAVSACSTACLVFMGFYMTPIVNVIIGIIIGKICKKSGYVLTGICLLLIVFGQAFWSNKCIAPMKEYDAVANICTDIKEKMNADVFYVGEDPYMMQLVNDGDVGISAASYDNITESGVIIFDSNIPEKYILHKYIVMQDNRFIVCFNDVSLAEDYQSLGGECTIKECNAQISVNYSETIHTAELTISNVTEGYHDLSAAVWGEDGEIIWYSLEDCGSGQFRGEADFTNYKIGEEINIHVYGTFENEEQNFIAGAGYVVSNSEDNRELP